MATKVKLTKKEIELLKCIMSDAYRKATATQSAYVADDKNRRPVDYIWDLMTKVNNL